MAQFEVQASAATGLPVVVVRCPACRAKGEHPLSSVAEGSVVPCSACGHAVVVTRDHIAWIRSRADMIGVPNQQPFVSAPR